MVIGIFGESCTGKSTLAQKIAARIPCEVFTGKDYLRLAKNENIAKAMFQKKLNAAISGEHIIYVNGADKDASTALGKLMHDFFCTDPDDMHYKELADKVRYFKEDEKGVVVQ